MSEEENIDDYLSSREREHAEDQNQPSAESVAGGVYKATPATTPATAKTTGQEGFY
jgi:hypothetical protein